MNDQDVTHVTGNREHRFAEIKLACDLIASAALIYYATHPDCLDGWADKLRKAWTGVQHRMSVLTVWQQIQNLPETDK